MKKLFAIPLAGLLFLSACSDKETEPKPEGIVFELSAVDKLSNGIESRGPIYSQDAVHTVSNVNVYVFQKSGSDYLYLKTFNIPSWTTGSNFKRYDVPTADRVPQGDYKFLAVGRDASDLFTLTTLNASTNYNTMAASVATAGQEIEIFSGTKDATVPADLGVRVPITITRQVGGILGYFKNVPTDVGGVAVRYLRLSVSGGNKMVNLTTGVGSSPGVGYNIINVDLSTQGVSTDGTVFTGNDLTAQGVVKVANSQLFGAYVIPVNGVQLTLALYAADGIQVLKSWNIVNSGSTSIDITPNNFYALGTKVQMGNTTGGGTPDAPIDLLTDQVISVTIAPAWGNIYNLGIENP